MEKREGKRKRWKKFTAFVISAAMFISFIPGTVYAADESGNLELRSEIVSGQDAIVVHAHNWSYTKTRFITNDQEITASCQTRTPPCTISGNVHLTMKVEKDPEGRNKVSVLAEGRDLASSNDLGIRYTIKYLDRYGSEIQGTQPPRADGTYKVCARFGSETNGPYLEADYIVKHEHRWVYGKFWDGTGKPMIAAVCQNTQDTICPVSGSIKLTLKVTRGPGDKSSVSVLANGTKITNDNRWNIGYEIKYYDWNGNEIGTEPPKETGIYKVRAVFDGGIYLGADYEVVHTHRWEYKTNPDNDQQVIAVCKNTTESTCPLYGNTLLTVRAAKDPSGQIRAQVQANGEELTDNNSLGIRYTIRYFRIRSDKTEESLTSAPQADGIYRARTTFGSASSPYLDIRYRITQGEINDHKHTWTYVVENPGTVSGNSQAVSVSCQGSGTCVEGADGIRFVLDVQKVSAYTEEPQSGRVTLSLVDRNGRPLDLDLEDLGIRYQIAYYEDENGYPGHTALEQEPQGAGKYRVKVEFESDVTLEDTFEIRKVELVSGQVVMNSYTYGDNRAKSPSIKGVSGIQEITYHYYDYKGNETTPEKFNAKILNAGTYYIEASFTRAGDEDHTYRTGRTEFTVAKADRKGIKLTMKSYGLRCKKKPEPGLNNIEENAKTVYLYRGKNGKQWTKWTTWVKGKTNKQLKSGTYQMYVKVAATTNYKALNSKPITFKVYADHSWMGMPKDLSTKKRTTKINCDCCGTSHTVTLPPKTMNITLSAAAGSTAKWLNGKKSTGCTFAIDKKSPNRSYVRVDKRGKLTANAKDYARMQLTKPVKVKVVSYGKTYTMNVKLKIGEPKVTISAEWIMLGGVTGYRFIFQYNVPRADRITVDIDGQTAKIKQELDRYVSGPRSTSESYINLSDAFLQTSDYEVTFRITAYYGKNRSETQVVSMIRE